MVQRKYSSAAEIAEMKARGYDPETIRIAEKYSAKVQKLCQLIEDAFADIKLGAGVGLMEAQGLDDYADAHTLAAYRSGDEKDDWRRIPAVALNRCHSSLSFFDAEGMRFHLPAFLSADLKGSYDFGMAFCLTRLGELHNKQFALFTPAQRSAVRAFLLHIYADPDYKFDRPDIRRALNTYWTEPIAPASDANV